MSSLRQRTPSHRGLPTLLGLAAITLMNGVAGAQPALDPDPAAVRSGTYELDPLHSRITWTTSHFGLSRYSGQLADLTGRLTLDSKHPEQAVLEVIVPMTRGGTFQSNLDQRLQTDFFDVQNHPTTKFSSTRVVVLSARAARVSGNLTLKGVTKPITIVVSFNAAGNHPVSKKYTIGFNGEATIKRSEFGITAALPAIGDDVHLDIEAELRMPD